MKIMTGFVLTPDRRDQLATLLGDEARLRSEHPKVAEYLEMAPNLPGTGNEETDRGFDIRLIHYMTGDDSQNPYWDIVAALVSAGPAERDNRREVNGGKPNGSARLAFAQTILQAAYAYAIPSPETLQWVVSLCNGRGLLETGAGRGYWAHLLQQHGLDVLAFDSEPPDSTPNVSFPETSGQRSVWHPVGSLADLERTHSAGDRVLFLCWPPGWGDPMALNALTRYADAGGDRLIYIGEPKGGKTGTDEFFDALTAEWTLEAEDKQFVSWWNLSDVAQCWVRRS